jgi:hypothetical protein
MGLVNLTLLPAWWKVNPPLFQTLPMTVAVTNSPPAAGKMNTVLWALLRAGASAVTVMSACLSAVVIAGLTITDVLRPITVAGADFDVVADEAVDFLLLVVVPLPAVAPLFEPPPHAPGRSATAAIALTARNRCTMEDIRKGLAYLSESRVVG